VVSRTQCEDVRPSDQWTMPEMWLSPCVGISSRKNVRGAAPTTFQRWLILSLIKSIELLCSKVSFCGISIAVKEKVHE
jgi:hypothetical protein